MRLWLLALVLFCLQPGCMRNPEAGPQAGLEAKLVELQARRIEQTVNLLKLKEELQIQNLMRKRRTAELESLETERDQIVSLLTESWSGRRANMEKLLGKLPSSQRKLLKEVHLKYGHLATERRLSQAIAKGDDLAIAAGLSGFETRAGYPAPQPFLFAQEALEWEDDPMETACPYLENPLCQPTGPDSDLLICRFSTQKSHGEAFVIGLTQNGPTLVDQIRDLGGRDSVTNQELDKFVEKHRQPRP